MLCILNERTRLRKKTTGDGSKDWEFKDGGTRIKSLKEWHKKFSL
jgi:hypothetical protein